MYLNEESLSMKKTTFAATVFLYREKPQNWPYILMAISLFILVPSTLLYFEPQLKIFGEWVKDVFNKISPEAWMYLAIVLILPGTIFYLYLTLQYKAASDYLVKIRKSVQKENVAVVQSFLNALQLEVVTSSTHIEFKQRQSLFGTKPLYENVSSVSVFAPLAFLALGYLAVVSLFTPSVWWDKVLFLVIFLSGLGYFKFKSQKLINNCLSYIKQDIQVLIRESSSPASKACLFSQSNSKKLKFPTYAYSSTKSFLTCPVNQLVMIMTSLGCTIALLKLL